jgi:ribosomal protein L12E/L44/L45/RPP1/RPP2
MVLLGIFRWGPQERLKLNEARKLLRRHSTGVVTIYTQGGAGEDNDKGREDKDADEGDEAENDDDDENEEDEEEDGSEGVN